MRRSKDTAYEKRFIFLAAWVEKWLTIAIVGGWVLLLASQFLLAFDSVRYFLVDTVRLEGIASP
ncbi:MULTISPECIES: hypothetical protein [Aneurinibacillus]|uniref:Uncharacterized protein n=1 Tax=Aneurinibacillus thermoaerophilus TaxID=143495 RepID=A0A1G7XJ91_ANETH|nr:MULTISPECIES: hypothetical protein [Aneurinibacillus]MED0674990.1 hypothetical protein [Aneurinibacillus thermoaerophilus]MED0679609.1 hypothetical protein [Aneurinibacillus thermoaerophilus]MED0737393.1 hypothetical protein [Aneurinibacillus thermoaerophilus]MED0756242.1 hypothetical protein [Aneurinibacillus thermoaerophilus]MED0760323.1 hypothetical protein [Aneurinibacillus thermoaerophilus]